MSAQKSKGDISKKKIEKRFCRFCGSVLITRKAGAEKYTRDEFFTIRYPEFDSKTGKRNYLLEYSCPNSSWFSKHDEYAVNEYGVCEV